MSTLFMGGPLMPTNLQGTLQGQDVLGQQEAELLNLFQSLQQQIQNAPEPQQVPVPPVASPLASAGATFASTLASSILRQPGLALQTQARLERDVRAAQDAQRFNVQQKSLSDKLQFQQMLGLRIKELDIRVQALRDAGKLGDAIKLLKMKFGLEKDMAKFEEEIDKEAAEFDEASKGRLKRLQSGLDIGETATKIQAEVGATKELSDFFTKQGFGPKGQFPPSAGGAGGVAEKPMTPSQFASNLRLTQRAFPGETVGIGIDIPFTDVRIGQPRKLRLTPQGIQNLRDQLVLGVNTGVPSVKIDATKKLVNLFRDQFGITDKEEIRQAMLDAGVNPVELGIQEAP